MKKMKMVLLKDVINLGKSGDVVEVKGGRAQNLISSGLASVANSEAIQKVEARKSSEKYAEQVEKDKSEEIFNIINDKVVTVEVFAGDNGKLHESITSSKISEALNNQFAVTIPKNKIRIEENEHGIKAFGMHDVSVHLFTGIVANIHVNVLQGNN